MTPSIFQSESCNRREFVLATGIFVTGSMFSCTGVEEQATRPTKDSTTRLPHVPVLMRVRIGRNVQSVTIGNTTIFRTRGAWRGTNTPSEQIVKIETKPNTTVHIAEQTKKISGPVMLHPRSERPNNSFDVVVHVPIEQYLPGVLAGELFAHWHPSTFAAQAVAARSYATNHHLERINTSHFDVTDNASSQMFLGEVTLDVAHRAVQETEGVMLHWNNVIIPAYYSACCGGLAATASDAISGAVHLNIPPLDGHSGKDICTSLDIHKWSASRSARVLRKRLNACAKPMNLPRLASIRTIRTIEPISTNQHGRPTALVIKGRRGDTVEVRARDFIRAVNATVPSLPVAAEQVWSSFLVGEKNGIDLNINGYGMGHGVGLCQYGAQELAGKGEQWEDILKWYYPRATL